MTQPTPQENKTWQERFRAEFLERFCWQDKDGSWILNASPETVPKFINFTEAFISQTRQDTLREVEGKWNKIHMLDHYDKDNDSFWEKEYGNCHVRSFHIDEYEDFQSFLSSNLQKK